MTTLKVEHINYNDDVETVYYKLNGEYPRFEVHDGTVTVLTNKGAQLVLKHSMLRSAVLMNDDKAVEDVKNISTGTATVINVYAPEGLDPRAVSGVVRQGETLW